MSKTVLAKTSELAWIMLEENGINPLPIFRAAHINPKTMRDMNARYSQATLNELWSRTATAIDTPSFGLQAGDLWQPAFMHALGYAWMSSSSLRTALHRLVRYIHIVNQSSQIELKETKDRLTLTWNDTGHETDNPWFSDIRISIILAMCRANFGPSLNPMSVTLFRQAPAQTGRYYEIFKCPVEFSAEKDSMTLSVADADKMLPSSNPLMSQVHDQIMVKCLAELDDQDIIEQVKASIIDLLPDGRMSDVKVAETLFISNRTLQRKLQAQNTSFKTILTQVREDLALKYIRDSRLTLTELSFQLGFSEMSAFSRAFKQWTGASPKVYRQSL